MTSVLQLTKGLFEVKATGGNSAFKTTSTIAYSATCWKQNDPLPNSTNKTSQLRLSLVRAPKKTDPPKPKPSSKLHFQTAIKSILSLPAKSFTI